MPRTAALTQACCPDCLAPSHAHRTTEAASVLAPLAGLRQEGLIRSYVLPACSWGWARGTPTCPEQSGDYPVQPPGAIHPCWQEEGTHPAQGFLPPAGHRRKALPHDDSADLSASSGVPRKWLSRGQRGAGPSLWESCPEGPDGRRSPHLWRHCGCPWLACSPTQSTSCSVTMQQPRGPHKQPRQAGPGALSCPTGKEAGSQASHLLPWLTPAPGPSKLLPAHL